MGKKKKLDKMKDILFFNLKLQQKKKIERTN